MFAIEAANHAGCFRKPIIATNASFFGGFRDLQDFHTFAPLESKWKKKKLENHLVDPTEKSERAITVRNSEI